MPSLTIPLRSLTLTSSMTDTSTASTPAVDISDAVALSGLINGTTTAPGVVVQVAYTTETTAAFVTLGTQTVVVITSAATVSTLPWYLTSAQAVVIPVAALQARIGTSGAHTSTGMIVVWAKHIRV